MSSIDPELFKHKDAIAIFKRLCDLRQVVDDSDPLQPGSGSGGHRGLHEGRRGTSSFSYVRKVQGGKESHDFFTGGYGQRDLAKMLDYLRYAYGEAKSGGVMDERTGEELPISTDISLSGDAPKTYIFTANVNYDDFSLRWNSAKTGTAMYFPSGAALKGFMDKVQTHAAILGLASEIGTGSPGA